MKLKQVVTSSECFEMVGKVVTLDIEGCFEIGVEGSIFTNKQGRVLVSGVLNRVEDHFESNGDLTSSSWVIGNRYITAPWDKEIEVLIGIR